MSKKQINWIGTFDRIKKEDDLKPKPGININPPSEDGKCDCCGRHISELKPYGGPGDPLVGDFTGALLVKMYRDYGPPTPYDEEAEKAFKEAKKCYEADGFDDPADWLFYKYEIEKCITVGNIFEVHGYVESSWECRDCAVLDMEEYSEKIKHWKK